MACAEKILSIEGVSAKFASHNAHTIAAINEMAKGKEFEYQRLYGMGELLYKKADEVFSSNYKTSIYAPIGKYKDLLPYLVRRLLEMVQTVLLLIDFLILKQIRYGLPIVR